ncbi:hypothetical protein [Mycobacterium phage GS4E]|nr:hypothetical protein [Mycobacterium phage GS4E]
MKYLLRDLLEVPFILLDRARGRAIDWIEGDDDHIMRSGSERC